MTTRITGAGMCPRGTVHPRLTGTSLRTTLMATLLLLPLLLTACGAATAHGAATSHPSPTDSTTQAGSPTPSTPTPSTAPSSVTPSPPPSPAPPSSYGVVALGDSVTAGATCGCTAFPQLYAKDLTRTRGVHTTVSNDGVGGLTSTQLLHRLDTDDSKEARGAADADIDIVTIGANDFNDHHEPITNGSCAGSGNNDCVEDELDQLRHNMVAIVDRIHTLRGDRPSAVLVTGYWNVFQDGDVARSAFSAAGQTATRTLTLQANKAIAAAAVKTGATYVDLYAPFHATRSDGDVTHLLLADGDHPNAKGHALIADQLIAAGLPGLVKS